MNDELKEYLEKHGIDPAVLLGAIGDFVKNGLGLSSDDIDGMLKKW